MYIYSLQYYSITYSTKGLYIYTLSNLYNIPFVFVPSNLSVCERVTSASLLHIVLSTAVSSFRGTRTGPPK